MSYGYLEKMLTLLTGAYNRRDIKNAENGRPMETNIGRLFALIAWGFEMAHTTAETVRLWDDLDNAEGAVLDRYGANFGVVRGAASDPLYRILIRVKMLAQVSGGDDDTIIRAAAELLGVELTDIDLEDVFPAKKALFVDLSLLSEERVEIIEQIARAIKRILAAGVGLRLYLRTHRVYRSDLTISLGGSVGANFLLPPHSEDKTYHQPVFVEHGGFLAPTRAGIPAEVQRAVRGRQNGAGGMFYHTRITSKRVE